jgi:hypothetical protein
LPTLFRCYIAAHVALGDFCYPEFLRDEVGGREWCGLLPLELDGAQMDCFFVDDGPYLICEAVRDSIGAFRRHATAVRMMLTYLTAHPLDGKSCDVTVAGDDGSAAEVRWNDGRGPLQPSIWSQIPIRCSSVGAYRASKRLPLDGKMLAAGTISGCVQKLLDEPDLETPLVYIRLALDAPVELRGALLSVALEALTGHLKAKGIVDYPLPLRPPDWDPLLTDLMSLLDVRSKSWPAEQRDLALKIFQGGIKRLNLPTNTAKLTAPFAALGISLTVDVTGRPGRRGADPA